MDWINCKTLDDIQRELVMLENDCTGTAMIDLSELSYALERAAQIGFKQAIDKIKLSFEGE